jgi:hypothetical protein
MKRTIRRSSREDLAQTGKWSRRSLSQSAAPVCCPSPQRGEARAALALNLPSGDPTLGASGGGANVGPSPSLTVAFVSAACSSRAAPSAGSEASRISTHQAAALPASGSALPPRLWRAEAEPQAVCAAARLRPHYKDTPCPPPVGGLVAVRPRPVREWRDLGDARRAKSDRWVGYGEDGCRCLAPQHLPVRIQP